MDTLTRVLFLLSAIFFLAFIGLNLYDPKTEIQHDGSIKSFDDYLLYIPKTYQADKASPLVFALSPTADPEPLIAAWSEVADRRGWLVAASRVYKNGLTYEIVLPTVERDLGQIEKAYPIDKSRILLSGFSGGAMGSYRFTLKFPERITAVFANTGMLDRRFSPPYAAKDKLAVLMASPTDFRYQEMKNDKIYLDEQGWKTEWIEFIGGHQIAPAEVYERAARWLETKW